jgi:hypothetical protein
MSNENNTEQNKSMTMREFLETVPTAESRFVTGEQIWEAGVYYFRVPEISLFCNSDCCQGPRLHQANPSDTQLGSSLIQISRFNCKNCGAQNKIYSFITGKFEGKADGFQLTKLGEYPLFGLYVPPRTLRLLQPDAELFKKGVRAESQGYGIGAFAYYRQIVERQRGHLLKEIKKVAARLGATPEILKEYDDAISQFQFAQSIEQIKHGLPQSLLINGHNPLTLLHSALSEGIHAGTDEECLEIAASIRIVLSELANRISEALKDEKQLSDAVNRLSQKKQVEGAA